MPYKNLREFIAVLEQNDELIKITEPVSPDLEITAITDKVSKSGNNKALLFENVIGYEMPVLINSLGSYTRLNLAFQVDNLDQIAQRIKEFLDLKVPDGLFDKFNKFKNLSEVLKFPPKVISGNAPCQEVIITNPDQDILNKLPILKCWPHDGGHYITMPLVFSKDPVTGIRNIGMYRLQKYNNTETGFHVHWHHDTAEHQQIVRGGFEAHGTAINTDNQYKPKSKAFPEAKIPIAIAIGADPSLIYSATAPFPKMVDETIFAGFLRSSPVELVKCKTIDMEVPANAEIILEGYVHLDDLREEGPFGDHTGFYSLAGDFPTFHITAMTHRKDPIYMTTIVGKPPQEDCYLGKATERIFLPLLRVIMPEVEDMNLPLEGVFHSCAIVKIKKSYPGHAKKIINAVWGSGQLAFTKYVIVLDHDTDIHNLSEVAWKVFANTDPKRDILFTEGPVDILDHASPLMGLGSKAGIDATVKWKEEGFNRDWPTELSMTSEVNDKVNSIINKIITE